MRRKSFVLAVLAAAVSAAVVAAVSFAAGGGSTSPVVTLHLIEKDQSFHFVDNPPVGGQNSPPSQVGHVLRCVGLDGRQRRASSPRRRGPAPYRRRRSASQCSGTFALAVVLRVHAGQGRAEGDAHRDRRRHRRLHGHARHGRVREREQQHVARHVHADPLVGQAIGHPHRRNGAGGSPEASPRRCARWDAASRRVRRRGSRRRRRASASRAHRLRTGRVRPVPRRSSLYAGWNGGYVGGAIGDGLVSVVGGAAYVLPVARVAVGA